MVVFFFNICLQIFNRGFIIHVFRHYIKSKLFLTDYIISDFKNPQKSKAQWYLYRWHQNYQPYLVEPRGIDLPFLPAGKKIMVLPPSSWRQADVHRTSALKWFDPPSSVLPKIKATLMGGFYFWWSRGESICIFFPQGRKLWCCRHLAGGKQMSTGHLH
jgi:hypothetical protein